MKKETSVKQYIRDDGMTIIELNCTICGHCPCQHTELKFGGVELHYVPKVRKDLKRRKTKSLCGSQR